MSCETVIGSIVALLDGELADTERQELEVHLRGCASCRRELTAFRATRRVVSDHLEATGDRVVLPSFEAVWDRLEGEAGISPVAGRGRPGTLRQPSASRPGRSRRRWMWAGAGAGLALAAGLAMVVLAPRMSELAPGSQAARPEGKAAAQAPAVAAKPVTATRVAKRDHDGDAPAKQQVARRAEPKPAPERATQPEESGTQEAVAVNELDPPRELLERPDLFLNYPLVRKLDELRHLESVLADQGDDQPDDGGAG